LDRHKQCCAPGVLTDVPNLRGEEKDLRWAIKPISLEMDQRSLLWIVLIHSLRNYKNRNVLRADPLPESALRLKP
jgi:hypothetical protein